MSSLYLCSQSPRRHALLEEAGFNFHSLPVEVSEIPSKNLNVIEQIREIAARKAKRGLEECNSLNIKDFVVLTADTAVVLDQQFLGKPQDFSTAVEILESLSGRKHEVVTAFCLADSQDEMTYHDVSTVQFFDLSDEQIQRYVESGEPMDKAGAYGIQGLGAEFVQRYEGSYSNIVGLPMEMLVRELGQWGIFPSE